MADLSAHHELRQSGNDIAVIGMACRFPGAPDVDAFWSNLVGGVESIRFFTIDELRDRGVSESVLRDPQYVRANGVLEGIDLFDADFFGFSPRDAAIMDPQHRVFLECAWESLENAGYDPSRYTGSIGVFGGCGMNAYMMYNLISNPDLVESVGEFMIRHTGNDKDFLCTRVSYNFDLKGPSINVQTACSTSLVAVHLASQHLLSGECDIALAGGVTLLINQMSGYRYEEGEILSSDGHCRPFDASSSGTVFGSGAGLVVLKRLDEAIADRDTIHAVIRGSAVNNDGSLKVSFLAPSVDGQARAIAEALAIADVDPATVGFIEAHGTGTQVGDPIELEALRQSYGGSPDAGPPCAVGSVKSNFGHLDTAAGVASLIKSVLAVKHGVIPPTLHFRKPNPELRLEESRFFVSAKGGDWDPADGVRRAGVSSLGVGGTNAHVIVEQPPDLAFHSGGQTDDTGAAPEAFVFPVSAKTPVALVHAATQLSDHVLDSANDIASTAYTLCVGRAQWKHRVAVVADSPLALARQLRGVESRMSVESADHPFPVFLFAGGGAQYARMGADVYERDRTYASAFDRCANHFAAEHGIDLSAVLTGPSARAVDDDVIRKPSEGLAALFATQFALAEWWRSRGISPGALIGHSMGEYTAVCLAGLLTPEQAMDLVAVRARLFESLPRGSMLSVAMPERALGERLPAALSIAAVNAPELCVVSGPTASIEAFEVDLTRSGQDCRRVRIDVAAHSAMIDEILQPFEDFVRTIAFGSLATPVVSNLTGRVLDDKEARDPTYWVRHLRNTVRFSDAVASLAARSDVVLFEVGPGRTLTGFARQHAGLQTARSVASMRHPKEAADDVRVLKEGLAAAWTHGLTVDWSAEFEGAAVGRVPLPTYPFQRRSYWIHPGRGAGPSRSPATGTEAPSIRKRADLASWIYTVKWVRASTRPARVLDEHRSFVVVCDWGGVAEVVAERLRRERCEVVLVQPDADSIVELVRTKSGEGNLTDVLVLSPLNVADHAVNAGAADHALRDGYFAVLHAGTAVASAGHVVRLYAATAGSVVLSEGDKATSPWASTVPAAVQVLGRELPELDPVHLDLDPGLAAEELAERIVEEIRFEPGTRSGLHGSRAVRSGGSFVPRIEPAAPPMHATLIRRQGTYVFTGGLGGVALSLAREFVERYESSVVLLTREPFPPPAEWSGILAVGTDVETIERIGQLRELERSGGRFLVLHADVLNREQLARAVERARDHFGEVHGIFHTAGRLDEKPALAKTSSEALAVLAPKVHGTLHVVETARETGCEFVVLFSSTSAFLCPPGQVDYAAANAFVDAAARHLDSDDCRVLSVGWGLWRNVGMTRVRRASEDRPPRSAQLDHPLFHSKIVRPDEVVYRARLDASTDWYVNEHRLADHRALMPGTLVLELARAAFELETGARTGEVSDVLFEVPVFVPENRGVEIELTLVAVEGGFTFSITTGHGSDAVEHACGSVRPLRAVGDPKPQRLVDARAESETPFGLGTNQGRYLRYGPRWNCVESVIYGSNGAEAQLTLGESYFAETEVFGVHPALLDMATSFGLGLDGAYVEDPAFYVPVSFGRVQILDSLPPRCTSFISINGATGSATGLLSFDIVITDTSGEPVVVASDFLMKRVDAGRLLSAEDRDTAAPRSLFDLGAHYGIEPKEAAGILQMLIAEGGPPSHVVTSVDWNVLVETLHEQERPTQPGRESRGDYAEPTDDIERELAAIWTSLLGTDRISIHDDFFDLGGHSLVAVRLFARIRSTFGVEMSLATLFEASTISSVADIIRAQTGANKRGSPGTEAESEASAQNEPSNRRKSQDGEWTPLVSIRSAGTDTPFFCVHGAGGNVLNFRDLAVLLPKSRPFYGLQARGSDGLQRAHASIDAMAAEYVQAIRTVQPHGPYLIGGYSGGGVIAIEMARLLERAGEPVALTILLDTFFPRLPPRPGLTTSGKARNHLRQLRHRGPGYLMTLMSNKAKHLAFRSRVVRLRLRNRMGLELPVSLREIVMVDTFHAAAADYQATPYDGEVVLFTAADRSHIFDHLSMGLEWEPYLPKLRIVTIPGNHDNLVRQPNVPTLARLLESELVRAEATTRQHIVSEAD